MPSRLARSELRDDVGCSVHGNLLEPIADIEYIVTEDDVRPTLTNHGVRLDAFVKTKNEIYDIEMQTTKREDLGRRMRYYQGALDTLTLRKGEGYEELPPCIIIFICMHDPFDEGLPVYTLDVNCLEKPSARIGHGFLWKALSAPAWGKLPEGRLRNLLHYVWTGEAGEDPLMGQLAVAVKKANKNENWRKEKMALLTFEEDMEIQRRIAEKKGQERGQIIGLQMGLEQGLAEGLGCTDPVSSPTFAIVNYYRGPRPFAHFDLYRISTENDLCAAGFYDYLDQGAIVAAEWSENFADLLALEDPIRIHIERLDDTTRRITIEGVEL